MNAKFVTEFNARLDQLLGLTSNLSKTNHPKIEAVLQVANLINELDFDAELIPRTDIRSRWERQAQNSSSKRSTRQLPASRWAWVFILVILLTLLVTFHQPVFAAVSRMFGYVYITDVGFLPIDSTLMLKQPILQEHNSQTVTVTRGIATPDNIILFLEFNDTARPVDGAWLEIPSGERLELLQWQYWPNTSGSRGIQMIFAPLPSGITQTTLVLPEGWHLPLTWLPASQSNLHDVRAVPYMDATQEPAASSDLCVEKHGMDLCVLAAITSTENTSVLIQARPTNPQLIVGSTWQGLVWQTDSEQVKLMDERGHTFPMQGEQNGTLTFPPLAGNQRVTLAIPALLASVDIPDQNITVDVGDNPQPDTVIPLDAKVQVLGATVHFSKATFVGDGVNSLRLTLNADEPLQTLDGITSAALEMGKPERVDDLYGSGMLTGSKAIFIELIRPNGKITGVINIPIVSATVIVAGPFEFTLNLTSTASPTTTPAEANPNIFAPAPTPTPISLEDYQYNELSINTGDLLFTVLDGDKTNVYIFTPKIDQHSRLLATLPGAVAQLYLHPDRLGMDYLAGVQKNRDGIFYIDNISLYTVRFSESVPHLLFTFAPNPENTVGTIVQADWSFDGRYMVFESGSNPEPGGSTQLGWFDMACRANKKCVPYEISIKQNLGFGNSAFAPGDYRVLLSGADASGTGKPDLFLWNFDPGHPDNPIVNITTNLYISDTTVTRASWTPDGKIFDLCWDTTASQNNVFCLIDPETGSISYSEPVYPNLNGYRLYDGNWLALYGKLITAVIFPENATQDSMPELRLLDWNGHPQALLAKSQSINAVSFSPSGKFIAYSIAEERQLEIFDTLANTHIPVYNGNTPWILTWLAWVR